MKTPSSIEQFRAFVELKDIGLPQKRNTSGSSANGLPWKRCKNPEFFLPAKVLAVRFRNRLKHVFGEAGFQTDKQTWKRGWVVDVQAVGNGAAALKYLAHYVYRTALSSQNILKDQNNRITFHSQGISVHVAPGQTRRATRSEFFNSLLD